MLYILLWLGNFLPSGFSQTHHRDLFDLIFKLLDHVISVLLFFKTYV